MGPAVSSPTRRVYDHRVRLLVAIAGASAVQDLQLPRSTVATWRRRTAHGVTSSATFDIHEVELRARLASVERKLTTLRALLRLVLVLVHVRGMRLTADRLPDGQHKAKLLAAIARACTVVPRRHALAIVGLTGPRFRAWLRRQAVCELDDESPCPKRQPSRLTCPELSVMRDMAESEALRHMPIRTLAGHAKRIGRVFASAATWARTIREKGWRRPRKRVHPRPPKMGIRARGVGEILHVDVTVIRLLDGSRAYLQAVMDNFSHRILAWRISPALETSRTASLLHEAVQVVLGSGASAVTLLADSGVENVNEAVDAALNEMGISRVLAQVEIAWSNSMIEAWWKSLKHGWLFLNQLDTLAAVERLVAFYVQQHNEVMPHAALGGRTPNEVFRGEATDLQERVRVAHRAAVQERIAANQRLACGECPVPHAPTEGNTTSGEQYRKDE